MATPSLAMIPSGYKDGTLYSVLPNNAGGDFDVTRGSLATRVNKNGLIEPVGTLGADVVLNGDFEETGADQVTNGDFATDSDWSKGTGWSIGGGSANCDGTQTAGTQLNQNNTYILGKTYKITYTLSSVTAGQFRMQFQGGGATVVSTEKTSNGTYTDYLVSTANTSLRCRGDADFVGSITNITVEEVGQEWTLTDGCSITEQGARITSDGTYQEIVQVGALVIGDTYEIEYEITESVSGTIGFSTNFDSLQLKNTVGVHKFYGVAQNSTTLTIKRGSSPTDITIDNIIIKRLTGDDTPRIDYTDGGCPVLLTEPQSTNLITDSNDFSVSSWVKADADVVSNFGISPSGNLDADKITFNTTDTLARCQVVLGGMNVGNTYTQSYYLKSLGSDVTIRIGNSGANVGEFEDVTVTSEWQRFETTSVANDTTEYPRFQNISGIINTEILVYGAQIEELSYATSYIPTYGAVRTRLQDTLTGAGTVTDFNSTEGVLFVEVGALNDGVGANRYISLNSGDTINSVRIYFDSSGRIAVVVTSAGATTSYMQYSGATISEINKIALRYSDSDFTLWINGSQVASDSRDSGATPIGLNRVNFNAGSSGTPFFGKTSQVQVFKTALSDFELTQLTTI